MRIEADLDACVGAGMCAMTVAAVFHQSADDGRVVVKDVSPAEEQWELVREAVMLCPSGALSVTEP